ncbi:hypothetical protein BGZ82_011232 [Podila clonocystis]|nr:hypothetical protein BGZ82_011232 [Podila clonocystis]
MSGFLTDPETRKILRVAVPVTVGLASLAYLAVKSTSKPSDGFTSDKSIPAVRLRKGESVHDIEYRENPEQFLEYCEKTYGPIFNIRLMNQKLTVVGHPYIKEVFTNKKFSSTDAIDEVTGLRKYSASIVKSNCEIDNNTMHELLRDVLTPKLQLFTERIVEHLDLTLGYTFGGGFETKVVDDPLGLVFHIIAGTMAKVFMGMEIAQDPKVTESFIFCTRDFGQMLQAGVPDKSFWHMFSVNTKYGYLDGVLNPLHKHVQALVTASTPVIQERRRREAECKEKGIPYERPLDIMQILLDESDKYGFVDLEDMCGHILLTVLASVHSTVDACTNMLYFFAAYPQYADTLYNEQRDVLDGQAREREKERATLVAKANEQGDAVPEFDGTDLDPKKDRELTASAIRKMVYFDSYIREVFRYRSTRLNLTHKARKTVVFSNGQYISEGSKVIINMRSAHYNPEQGEDVNEFKPFKYVGQTAKSPAKAATDMIFFGMGAHTCPGRFLAISEMKILGSLFLQRYSRVEFKDREAGMRRLTQIVGDPLDQALILTSRDHASTEEATSVATKTNTTSTTTTTTTTSSSSSISVSLESSSATVVAV